MPICDSDKAVVFGRENTIHCEEFWMIFDSNSLHLF